MGYEILTKLKRRAHPPDGWKIHGVCRSMDHFLFYSDIQAQIREALEACGKCSVRTECLEYALANQEFGVWGGTTERQRRMMVRRLNYEKKKASFYSSTVT